jgi:hypothetical protein
MLAEFREPIASCMALHQLLTDALFQFRETPVNGRLTGAERLRGCKRAAGARHSDQIS